MKLIFLILIALISGWSAARCQDTECTGEWEKYKTNPVLGKEVGAISDACVLKSNDGTYRMYYSLYEQYGLVLSESSDGIKWGAPVVCLTTAFDTLGWEQDISQPFVLLKDGTWHLWYAGVVWDANAEGHAGIGYAVSRDGKSWTRKSAVPVLKANTAWEKGSVSGSHVIWDEKEKLFKMWYSAGDKFEPDAIGYATSKDGLHWEKCKDNPIFNSNKQLPWEQSRVTDCRVIKRANDYLMFYVGYADEKHGEIGIARSKDGIANWERFKGNPVIRHCAGATWDSEAVYKPSVLPDSGNNRWLLYYNGRSAVHNDRIFEQIGVAVYDGMELEF